MSGRNAKAGLDYAPWNTDIFENDTKIDELIDAEGWIGFSIYFYLCQKAYASDGYFYRWTFGNASTTARRMGGGIDSETVVKVVSVCLRVGLFDKLLFDKEGVLTSHGIQRRYVAAIAKRRVKKALKNLWLLQPQESANVVLLSANDNLRSANSKKRGANDTKSRVKESIIEDISPKVDISSCAETHSVSAPPVIALPLNDGTEYEVTQEQLNKWLNLYPAVNVMQELRNMWGWLDANPSKKKTKSGIKGFITRWLSKAQNQGGSSNLSYGERNQENKNTGNIFAELAGRDDW